MDNSRKKAIETRKRMLEQQRQDIVPASCEFFSVIDESIEHLLYNWQPPDGREDPRYSRDFVLVLGQGYSGMSIKEPSKGVVLDTCFFDGNIHNCSHALADKMMDDPEFREMVVHALQVYNAMANRKSKGGGKQ